LRRSSETKQQATYLISKTNTVSVDDGSMSYQKFGMVGSSVSEKLQGDYVAP